MYKNKYACHTKKYPEEVQSKSGRRIVLDSISFFFFFLMEIYICGVTLNNSWRQMFLFS